MKSNYMRSAEIKIAKNPDMSEGHKRILRAQVMNKEIWLQLRLYGSYVSTDSYARNNCFRPHSYFVDEFVLDEPPRYTTALTRENLERLIENVQATPARFIGTRSALENYYIPFEIELDRSQAIRVSV